MMMENTNSWSALLNHIANNMNPWFTLLSFIFLSLSAWVSLLGIVSSFSDKKGIDVFLEHVRQRLFVAVILFHFLALAGLGLIAQRVYPNQDAFFYPGIIIDQYIATWEMFWLNFIILFALTVVAIIFWKRQVSPYFRNKLKQHNIVKSDESISDIRDEIGTDKPLEFIPEDYYQDGSFFLGFDEHDEPIYVSDSSFAKRHMKILGPSQTGKGVGLGVLIDQAIRKGWGVWFNDIKPDDFIYHIMKQTCSETERDLKYIDLNGSFGTYEPFLHGSIRDREERIKKACRLNDTGTNADYYLSGNRTVLDYLMDKWDGTLTHLQQLLNGDGIPSEDQEWVELKAQNMRERIKEFLKLDALKPSSNRTQFNVRQSIEQGDVVYIRGSMTDKLVRHANVALLDEFIQVAIKQKQDQHIFMVLDEVRFLVTDSLADSLATLLSKDVNMAIAYQARMDLRNLTDKSLNVDSIANGIETNTLMTISYRGHDEETAKWIAGMTGTRSKTITKSEAVEVDTYGTEQWTGKKTYGQHEEFLITSNKILGFDERVGVFVQAGQLGQIIKTCWIPVREFSVLPTEPAPVTENVQSPPVATNDPTEDESNTEPDTETGNNQQVQTTHDDEAAELMKLMEQNL